jgi:hypothetical protein
MSNPAKRWCFTLNNYTQDELRSIRESAERRDSPIYEYIVFGREMGARNTPHLQGFLILASKLRLRQVKALPGLARCHLEISRGTPQEASEYCKKDGDYDEFGRLPNSQGKRTDFERLKEWIKEQPTAPSRSDLAEAFPSLYGRYRQSCLEFVEMFGRRPNLVDGTLREWQRDLDGRISSPPDDRKVWFVIDPGGNKGKSWLVRYWFSTRDDIQRLSIGKRDDLAYAIDVTKKIFVFDIPRGSMDMLQYSILEQLKDRMIFSAKYQSTCKVIAHKVHVIVFCNEEPDMNKMSRDRYKFLRITNL